MHTAIHDRHHEFGQRFGMPFDRAALRVRPAWVDVVTAVNTVLNVANNRTALAAAADHNARATGFGMLRQHVELAPPNIVAEDIKLKTSSPCGTNRNALRNIRRVGCVMQG